MSWSGHEAQNVFRRPGKFVCTCPDDIERMECIDGRVYLFGPSGTWVMNQDHSGVIRVVDAPSKSQ